MSDHELDAVFALPPQEECLSLHFLSEKMSGAGIVGPGF